ncbi:MAG TPA: ABC transporter substrate-binding protein [Candidatus Limnocylindrales bacterium]|nr:ABC transporter substrate-binding protein [Candidatus Limnocylindrales bacterium]
MAKRSRSLAVLAAVAIFATACTAGSTASNPVATGAAPSAAASGAASSAPSAPLGTLPKPEKTDIKIGLSVTETSQFAAQLAEMAGIYKKNGLNVQITVFEGDGKVMQALQAGQLDVGFGGTSAFITSQTTDVPVKGLAVNAVILTDELVSTANVKTADDLKGKCVAVSTYGGTSHGAVILSLKALNLTPEDVVITEVGGQSARIAALQGGACAAAPVDAARHEEMAGLGFNFLVNLKEAKLPWGRSGLGVTEDWLAANPNTATVVAASVLEAQNMMWTDPDKAAEYYAKFTQETDVAKAKALILEFQQIGNRPMTWTDEAFQNPKDVLATVNPAMKDVPVTDAFDRSVLDNLKAIGFYEANKIPTE